MAATTPVTDLVHYHGVHIGEFFAISERAHPTSDDSSIFIAPVLQRRWFKAVCVR